MRAPLLLLLLIACAHAPQLIPAPGAPRDPDSPDAAAAAVAGVEVSVGGKRWSGQPPDLDSLVTPLYVSVRNGGGVPVRIRYADFTVTARSGLQTAAIPPFQIQRPGSEVVALAPAFRSDRFLLYERYRRFYPGLSYWDGPWDYDPWFYDQYYSTWQPSLPTKDMLQQALPEGVLQPAGSAGGFLYFHQLQEKGPVVFSAEIVAAGTREPLGAVRIPMVLQ
jgi:hypothetical protein